MFNEGDKVRFINDESFEFWGVGVVTGYHFLYPIVKWDNMGHSMEADERFIRKLTPLELAML